MLHLSCGCGYSAEPILGISEAKAIGSTVPPTAVASIDDL